MFLPSTDSSVKPMVTPFTVTLVFLLSPLPVPLPRTVRPALSATVVTACTDSALGEEGIGRRGHGVSPAGP